MYAQDSSLHVVQMDFQNWVWPVVHHAGRIVGEGDVVVFWVLEVAGDDYCYDQEV